MEVIAARTMNALYMYLDVAFLLFLGATLVYTKRYLAIIVGLLAGILYFIVDYGYFYLYLGTRSVEGADPFSPVVKHELWFHEFRMDMALARPGQTGIGMVHLDYRLLVYHLVTKPKFRG